MSDGFRGEPIAGDVFRVTRDGARFADVFEGFRDGALAEAWSRFLADCPFEGFCLETPPIVRATLAAPFECVLVRSPALARIRPDAGPFEAHFRAAVHAVTFESLGRDALLVAPTPGTAAEDFAHLARFVRTASVEQQRGLWREVAHAVERRVSETVPFWLSTAGLGVSWLHVRLDARPKYYRYRPYT